MPHTTSAALLAKPASSPGPAWIEADPARPAALVKAFRCQSCGKYVRVDTSGQLRPHWLHLVGQQKRREPQHQCQDTARYNTTDTLATPYKERRATITPA